MDDRHLSKKSHNCQKEKRKKKVSMDDRHFGYRPKTLKHHGATEACALRRDVPSEDLE
jgi:hypothetical protein